MDGIINLYKDVDMTSQQAVSRIKRILNVKKAGHTGTLDPLAQGVLPILLGRATKIQEIIMRGSKVYDVKMLLGITTDTEDITGEILSNKPVSITFSEVEKAVSKFIGEIMQIPPMYSAIKVNGKKLYQLAREGIEIEREQRLITIYSCVITDFNAEEKSLSLCVHCSKGTYIRTLCKDIGEVLGCGACMSYLRRTETCGFNYENAVTLEQLEKSDNSVQYIISLETFFENYPKIILDERQERLLKNGVHLDIPRENFGTLEDGVEYALFCESGELLGMGKCCESSQFYMHLHIKI